MQQAHGAHIRPLAAGVACAGCRAEDVVFFKCPSCDFLRCQACWRQHLQVGSQAPWTQPVGVAPHSGAEGLGVGGSWQCVQSFVYRSLRSALAAVLPRESRPLRRSSGQSPSEQGAPLGTLRTLRLPLLGHCLDTCLLAGGGSKSLPDKEASPVSVVMPLRWQWDLGPL